MKLIYFEKDIQLICSLAHSFPDGISEAFERLERTIPEYNHRIKYGISCPNSEGVITYKAAVNELTEAEAQRYAFHSFTITQGTYLSETIENWETNLPLIGQTFATLLQDPRLDLSFPCLEIYEGASTMICCVRIVD